MPFFWAHDWGGTRFFKIKIAAIMLKKKIYQMTFSKPCKKRFNIMLQNEGCKLDRYPNKLATKRL